MSSRVTLLDNQQIVTKNEDENQSKVKRLLSFDFIRGFAIWMMIILHTAIEMYNLGWAYDLELVFSTNFFAAIMVVIIGYLGSFAGLFLIVSIAVNTFASHKRLKNGYSPEKILFRQIYTGVMVIILGYLTAMFLNYYGYLGYIIFQRPNAFQQMLKMVFHFETLHAIGWCIILNGALHYFIALRPASKKKDYFVPAVIIYCSIIITVILVTPFIHRGVDSFVENIYGIQFPQQQHQLPIAGVGEFFGRQFFIFLAGDLEPMFPYFATATIGSLLGMSLAQERPPKYLPLYLLLFSIAVLIGAILAILMTGFEYTFNRPSISMYLLSLFGQLIFVTILLYIVEYRGKVKFFQKFSLYWRRFGMISLSIYCLQIVDAVPRYAVQFFTGLLIILFYPQFTFQNSTIMNVGWQVATGMDTAWKAFIVTLLVIGWWSVIVWLWEKVNFIGSFEWMIASVSTITMKIPPSSRLKISKILYNIKPITFNNLFEKKAI